MDREDFMDIVYSELHSDGDNNRANRIIDAADEYAESAQLDTDCISRQAAIDAIENAFDRETILNRFVRKIAISAVRLLPPAQPEPNYDEWCTDCKEYDTERNCCPRWNKVIRQARRELQDEFVMTAVDGTLWVTVDDVQKVGRVIVDEDKSKFCRQFYMDAQPQRTGKWILDRSGAYCCSECMEPCAGYVMMKPRDKFCKMCGAKMEGEHDG